MAVTLTVNYTLNGQSIADNISNVTVNAVAHWSGGSWNATGECYGSITIDGTKYSFENIVFNTGKTTSGKQTVMTKRVAVKHNDDGTKNLKISASFYTGLSSSGTQGASATVPLKTISRPSTLSVGNGTLGTAQTLTVTRKSTSFTHTITATCSGTSTTICTKSSSTSISFTPPISWSSKNTTGTSVSVTYKITTYSGSTAIGSNSYTKTCSIPSSVKPSCTVSVSDPTGYASTYGGYVKGLSTFKVTVTPKTSYESAIASYKTTANGSTYTTASFTTGTLKSPGTLTISATVTDKRGRSGTGTTTATVLDYVAPKISTLIVGRCDEDGTANDQGDHIKVTYACSITSLNAKNTGICLLSYKAATASENTDVQLESLAGTYIFEADTGSSYNVTLSVTDDFRTVTKSTSASTAFTLMHWKADGTAMGIGKVAEESNLLDVGLETKFNEAAKFVKHLHFSKSSQIYGTDLDGMDKSVFDAQNENGNTVVGYGNYANASGGTHVYGHDLLFGVSNLATPGTYRPYLRQGMNVGVTLRTAGYVTNAKTEVHFIVPLSRPVVGSPTVTATSGNGFILRQGDAYTHGSSATTYITPTKYSVTIDMDMGALIVATFSNTTNVTNNSPIGIYWNGTITFS